MQIINHMWKLQQKTWEVYCVADCIFPAIIQALVPVLHMLSEPCCSLPQWGCVHTPWTWEGLWLSWSIDIVEVTLCDIQGEVIKKATDANCFSLLEHALLMPNHHTMRKSKPHVERPRVGVLNNSQNQSLGHQPISTAKHVTEWTYRWFQLLVLKLSS